MKLHLSKKRGETARFDFILSEIFSPKELSQRGVRKFLYYFSIVNCNSESTRSVAV